MRWDIHVARARDAGVAEDVIDAVDRGDMGALAPADALLVDFTARVHRQRMTDECFSAAVDRFGDDAVTEATILSAFTGMMIQLVQAFGLDSRPSA